MHAYNLSPVYIGALFIPREFILRYSVKLVSYSTRQKSYVRISVSVLVVKTLKKVQKGKL